MYFSDIKREKLHLFIVWRRASFFVSLTIISLLNVKKQIIIDNMMGIEIEKFFCYFFNNLESMN